MQSTLNWSAMVSSYRWTDWTIMALHLCSSVLGLFGNLIICLVIVCNQNLRSSTYTLIGNMALSDLLNSAVIPLQWHFCSPIYFDLPSPDQLYHHPPSTWSAVNDRRLNQIPHAKSIDRPTMSASIASSGTTSSLSPSPSSLLSSRYDHKIQFAPSLSIEAPSSHRNTSRPKVAPFHRSINSTRSKDAVTRSTFTNHIPNPSVSLQSIASVNHTSRFLRRKRTIHMKYIDTLSTKELSTSLSNHSDNTNQASNAIRTLVRLVVRQLPNKGQQVCAALGAIHLATCYVSTLTMTAIAYSRYKLLHSPLRPHVRLRGLLITIWTVSITMAIFATISSMRVSIYFGSQSFVTCRLLLRPQSPDWSLRQLRVLILFLTQYVLPFALTTMLYVRVLHELRSCAMRHSSLRSSRSPFPLPKRTSCTSDSARSCGSVASIPLAGKSNGSLSQSTAVNSIWPLSTSYSSTSFPITSTGGRVAGVMAFGSTNVELRRTKRRLTHMLVWVLTLFAFCWLPIHVLHLIRFLFRPFQDQDYCDSSFLYLLLTWLAMSTFAQNPFLYMYFSREIRASVYRLLTACFPAAKSKRNDQVRTDERGHGHVHSNRRYWNAFTRQTYPAHRTSQSQGGNSRFFAPGLSFQFSSASLPNASIRRSATTNQITTPMIESSRLNESNQPKMSVSATALHQTPSSPVDSITLPSFSGSEYRLTWPSAAIQYPHKSNTSLSNSIFYCQ